jgi:hypothetical protein
MHYFHSGKTSPLQKALQFSLAKVTLLYVKYRKSRRKKCKSEQRERVISAKKERQLIIKRDTENPDNTIFSSFVTHLVTVSNNKIAKLIHY